MNMEDLNRKHQLLNLRKRRLHELEKKLATLGVSADPSIILEIEDCKADIRRLKHEIYSRQRSYKRQNTANKRFIEERERVILDIWDRINSINNELEIFLSRREDIRSGNYYIPYNGNIMEMFDDTKLFYRQQRLYIPQNIDTLIGQYIDLVSVIINTNVDVLSAINDTFNQILLKVRGYIGLD